MTESGLFFVYFSSFQTQILHKLQASAKLELGAEDEHVDHLSAPRPRWSIPLLLVSILPFWPDWVLRNKSFCCCFEDQILQLMPDNVKFLKVTYWPTDERTIPHHSYSKPPIVPTLLLNVGKCMVNLPNAELFLLLLTSLQIGTLPT